MFTLYQMGFCRISKVARVQCEQGVRASLCCKNCSFSELFKFYRIVKRSAAKCVLDRASFHTENASSGTTFAREQEN